MELSLLLHFAIPPAVLVVLVLWVAGGLWCERNIAFPDSPVGDAVAGVAFVVWGMAMIALLLLFLGSLVGAVIGSYV